MRNFLAAILLSMIFTHTPLLAQEETTSRTAGSGTATGQETSTAHKLAGWWEEYSPSSNIVHFSEDGTFKLMLKKDEIMNMRSLPGTWKLLEDGNLELTVTLGEKSMTRVQKLGFENGEMLLTSPDGSVTRHRRHSGVLPEAYNW